MPALIKSVSDKIILGNYFISVCALSLVFATMLMNGLDVSLTPFSVFITATTFLHYNFHRLSGHFNFSGIVEIKSSFGKINLSTFDKLMYLSAIVIAIFTVFLMPLKVLIYLLPAIIFPVTYSIPVINSKGRRVRLSQLSFVKTPVIALVWGYTTVIIPLIEQNIEPFTSFGLMQLVSRSLFVFALCIPFEIRDIEKDKKVNVRTLPVLFGITATAAIGIATIMVEIITHHSMKPLTEKSILALDISSVLALFWIFRGIKIRNIYFYKLFVDGTMLLRFLFLYIALYL